MIWAQVSVAVDSGAVAHVSPPNVFAIDIVTDGPKGPYYAANGNEIKNLGHQDVRAQDQNGQTISFTFGVANITKPLASIYSITR